ncbi:MAG TPA: sulfite exporter TauE/SafE family protein [Gammaproteobacteria bacterium]|nr:sulfite exporter TauE/SafE family protein [Gammaproteobacteria bacterium]
MPAMIWGWLGALGIGLVLGTLGSGGSILTVPVLVYLFDQPEKAAIAGSLAVVGSISFVGAIPYARRGLVAWRLVGLFGIPGMIAAFGGAWAGHYLPGAVQLLLFAIVVLLAAALMLRPRRSDGGESARQPLWSVPLDGLGVGFMTGLVGVGGGFLIIPALVLLLGLPMRRAVGTSLCIIVLNTAAGFYKYLGVLEAHSLTLDWSILAPIAAIGIAGSLIGNVVGGRIPQAKLKRVFAMFLLVMGAYIVARTAPAVF